MIYWFSGTGNSRFAALRIASLTGDTAQAIAASGDAQCGGDTAGLVFPVHGWAPPEIVARFVKANAARLNSAAYRYAVMTCGDDAGKALDILGKAGFKANAAFTVTMPNTYVSLPGFDIDGNAARKAKLQACAGRIDEIGEAVAAKLPAIDIREGRFPRTKTYVLGKAIARYLRDDSRFAADGDCTSCGACAEACPTGNIPSVNPRPVWAGNCTGCLACYHVCPRHAIRFARQTANKGQYTLRRHQNEIPPPKNATAHIQQ